MPFDHVEPVANTGVAVTSGLTSGESIVIAEANFPPNSVANVEITVQARDQAGNVKIWRRIACLKRNGGAASAVGGLVNVVPPVGDGPASGWGSSANFAGPSGETGQVTGQGVSGANITWYGEINGRITVFN